MLPWCLAKNVRLADRDAISNVREDFMLVQINQRKNIRCSYVEMLLLTVIVGMICLGIILETREYINTSYRIKVERRQAILELLENDSVKEVGQRLPSCR